MPTHESQRAANLRRIDPSAGMEDPLNRTLYRLLLFLCVMLPLIVLGLYIAGVASLRDLAGPPRWALDAFFLIGIVISLILYLRLYWSFFHGLFTHAWSYAAVGLIFVITAHAIAQAYADQIIMQRTGLSASLFANSQRLLSLMLTAVLLMHVFLLTPIVRAIIIPLLYVVANTPMWLVPYVVGGLLYVAAESFLPGVPKILFAFGIIVTGLVMWLAVQLLFDQQWRSFVGDATKAGKRLKRVLVARSFNAIFQYYVRLMAIFAFLGFGLSGIHDWLRANTDLIIVQYSLLENAEGPYSYFNALGMSFPLDGPQCRNLAPDTWLKHVDAGAEAGRNELTRRVIIAHPQRVTEQVSPFFSFSPVAQRFRFSQGLCVPPHE